MVIYYCIVKVHLRYLSNHSNHLSWAAHPRQLSYNGDWLTDVLVALAQW